jgi:hypothetical protein
MNIRRTAAAITSAAALSVTGIALAQPASASPVVTGGLVNVTVNDVLNDSVNENEILSRNNVGIGVAAGIAASVCADVDAQVGVIARQLARGGDFSCEQITDAGSQTVDITQRTQGNKK